VRKFELKFVLIFVNACSIIIDFFYRIVHKTYVKVLKIIDYDSFHEIKESQDYSVFHICFQVSFVWKLVIFMKKNWCRQRVKFESL
jgi:hypothetical protein